MVPTDLPINPDRPLSRRAMLLGTVVVPVLVAACDAASPPGPRVGAAAPVSSLPPALDGAALADHVLRRATYGITPGDRVDIAAMGIEAWLDRQLDPSSIDDSAVEERLAGLATLSMEPADIRATYENDRGLIIGELTVARLVRAVHTERQLLEVMVGFWTDHLNIDMAVGPIVYLKGTDEREVIRPLALGRFADLLVEATASPAMLRYLDNASSRADGGNVPNENLARELLELHTVGVDGGYDEDDVVEVAHVLSGWTIDRRTGRMVFLDGWHSMDGVTGVLGWRPDGLTGRAAGVSLLDHLARLPQTAEHLAAKLCRRFVADEPPASLVERAAAAYLEHDTEIAPVVRLILTSDEFAAGASTKTRRPFELLAAQGRALGLDFDDLSGSPLVQRIPQTLRLLGEPLYTWPSPDGPPDVGPPWLNAGTMLQRWNVTLTLTGGDRREMTTDLERHRPADADDAGEFVERFATALGLEIDPVTIRACLDLLDLDATTSPAPDPSADELADLAALVLIAPAAHRR